MNGLNLDGIDDGVGMVPYYAPGLLADALKNTVDKTDASVVALLSSFMRFLSRVFGGSKPQPGTLGSMIEHDLSFVQDTIESSEFRDNPELLDEVALSWKESPELSVRGLFFFFFFFSWVHSEAALD